MTHDEKNNCEIRLLAALQTKFAALYEEQIDDREASGVYACMHEIDEELKKRQSSDASST